MKLPKPTLFKSIAIFAVLFLTNLDVKAQEYYTWISAGAGNWTNVANWDCGGCGTYPGQETDALVYFNDAADGDCTIDINNLNIRYFEIIGYDGTLRMGDNTLNITRSVTFTDATITANQGSLSIGNQVGYNDNFVNINTSNISVNNLTMGYVGSNNDISLAGSIITSSGSIAFSSIGDNSKMTIGGTTIDVTNSFTASATGTGTSINTGSGFIINTASSIEAQTITLTGTNTTLANATFTGNTTITKSGEGSNNFLSTVTFNGSTTVKNETALTMTFSGVCDFNGDLSLECTNANGDMSVANSANNTIAGNLQISHPGGGTVAPFGIFLGNAVTADSRVVFDGTNNQSITILNNQNQARFGRVTINKETGVVNIYQKITIERDLTLTSGIVNTSTTANLLEIAAGATATGNDVSFINGRIYKTGNDDFTFPVGGTNGVNTFLRPIQISAPAIVTSQFYAQYVYDTPPDAQLGLNLADVSGFEYWELERTTTDTDPVSVTLTWNENIIPADPGINYVTDPNQMRVAYYDGKGTVEEEDNRWENMGNNLVAGDDSEGSVQANDVPTFGIFTLGTATTDNILPIELLNYSASKTLSGISLYWETASELNTDQFIIERSADGKQFETLTTVTASGNSNTIIPYSFIDTQPLTGRAYYRLWQTDLDGKKHYCGVVTEEWDDSFARFNFYPVPVNSGHIYFSEKTKVSIINKLGKEVIPFTETDDLDVSSLVNGVYFLRSGDGRTYKFIKE